jgi:hypothetical protein
MTLEKHSGSVGWFGGLIALCLVAPSMAGSLEQGTSSGLHVAPRSEIRLAVRNGGGNRELRYRYNADWLRIDRLGENIPAPPVNLLDFGQGTLRIIHPHNGTWEQGAIGGVGNPAPWTPKSPAFAKPIEDEPLPTTARRAPPADWPEMPTDLPEGIGPGAAKTPSPAASIPGMPAGGVSSGMPAFPAMPEFPMKGMGDNEPMVLVSQNQTNELFGFSCRLYETAVPDHGTLSLWLCDNPSLPPFHLLAYEIPRRHGRPEWNEQVAQLLREGKMFPFRMVLKGEGDATLAEWSVLSIKTDVEKKDQEGLFEVPVGLYLLPAEKWGR